MIGCVCRKGGIDSDLVVIDVLIQRCFMEAWATRKTACVALGDVLQSAQSNGDHRAMQVMSHIPQIEQHVLPHCARDRYSAEKEETGSRKHSRGKLAFSNAVQCSHIHNNCASGHAFPRHSVPGTQKIHRIGRSIIMRMGVSFRYC
jgi:hypothetical protein